MSSYKPKLNLPNYTQLSLYLGGVLIVATVIIGGFVYKGKQTKSSNSTIPTTIANVITPSVTVQKKIATTFDGNYVGSAPVAKGISNANVTVSNNIISGRGNYVGGNDINIGLKIDGKVNADGSVSGSFSGSQKIEGVTISGGGTYTGKIVGNTATINYSASGEGQNFDGSIVLNKK